MSWISDPADDYHAEIRSDRAFEMSQFEQDNPYPTTRPAADPDAPIVYCDRHNWQDLVWDDAEEQYYCSACHEEVQDADYS